MSNQSHDLQEEFQTFIKQIIDQISQEIYLDDMKQLYEKYNETLSAIEEKSDELDNNLVELKEENTSFQKDLEDKQNYYLDSFKQFQNEVNKSHQEYLEKCGEFHEAFNLSNGKSLYEMELIKRDFLKGKEDIEEALEQFCDGYDRALQEYKDNIVKLNDEERSIFANQIRESVLEAQRYGREDVKEVFDKYVLRLKEMSQTVASAAQIRDLVNELKCTRSDIKNITDKKYIETLTAFEKKIQNLQLSEREKLVSTFNGVIGSQRAEFHKMLENDAQQLKEIAAVNLTADQLREFEKKLEYYTNRIEYMLQERMQEVLGIFSNNAKSVVEQEAVYLKNRVDKEQERINLYKDLLEKQQETLMSGLTTCFAENQKKLQVIFIRLQKEFQDSKSESEKILNEINSVKSAVNSFRDTIKNKSDTLGDMGKQIDRINTMVESQNRKLNDLYEIKKTQQELNDDFEKIMTSMNNVEKMNRDVFQKQMQNMVYQTNATQQKIKLLTTICGIQSGVIAFMFLSQIGEIFDNLFDSSATGYVVILALIGVCVFLMRIKKKLR